MLYEYVCRQYLSNISHVAGTLNVGNRFIIERVSGSQRALWTRLRAVGRSGTSDSQDYGLSYLYRVSHEGPVEFVLFIFMPHKRKTVHITVLQKMNRKIILSERKSLLGPNAYRWYENNVADSIIQTTIIWKLREPFRKLKQYSK